MSAVREQTHVSGARYAERGPWVSLLRSEREVPMIELLIMFVIGVVVVAIAVPAFYQQRDRARDSTAQASARTAEAAAIEIARKNDGLYSGPGGVEVQNLVAVEPTLEDVKLTVPFVMPDAFTVRVQSDSGNTFDITKNDDGTIDLTCASADDAGCRSDGTWD